MFKLKRIAYPAISAYVSTYADADKQGLVQGMITGMRGLCNGLGPAVYGFVFNLFHVDLTHNVPVVAQYPGGGERGALIVNDRIMNSSVSQTLHLPENQLIPGPPFVFGAFLVLLAILVTAFIPELIQYPPHHHNNGENSVNYCANKSSRTGSQYYYTSMQYQRNNDTQCVGSNANDCKSSGSNDEDISLGHSIKSKTSPIRMKKEDSRYEMHKRGPISSESQLPLMQDLEPL